MMNERVNDRPKLGKLESFPGICYSNTWEHKPLSSRIATCMDKFQNCTFSCLLAERERDPQEKKMMLPQKDKETLETGKKGELTVL